MAWILKFNCSRMYVLVLQFIILLYILEYMSLINCNYIFIFLCLFILLLSKNSMEKNIGGNL